jgi:hypothetical protein
MNNKLTVKRYVHAKNVEMGVKNVPLRPIVRSVINKRLGIFANVNQNFSGIKINVLHYALRVILMTRILLCVKFVVIIVLSATMRINVPNV